MTTLLPMLSTLLTPPINTKTVRLSANFDPKNLKITANFVVLYKNHKNSNPFDYQRLTFFLPLWHKNCKYNNGNAHYQKLNLPR